MSSKRYVEPSFAPSAKVRRQVSPDDHSEPMAVDPPSEAVSAGRDLSDEALVTVERIIRKNLEGQKLDNSTKGTDSAFQDVLLEVHYAVRATELLQVVAELPQSFLKRAEQVKTNAAKKSASDFVEALREAVNGNDWKLWAPVVTHGTSIDLLWRISLSTAHFCKLVDVFHTVIPDDPKVSGDPGSGESRVPNIYQEEGNLISRAHTYNIIARSVFSAVIKSWDTPFIGERALKALEKHIIHVKNKASAYAPYCSIVQSSGMGKSRLLDEFSKKHFLIPVNLRKGDTRGTHNPPFLPLWPLHAYVFRLSSSRPCHPRTSHRIKDGR